ncbi:MAG: hypothetical protein ACLU77_11530 [Waltera sp.]
MNRSNTSANKDIGHIVKDMLRLLVAYGVAVLFMGRAWSLRTLGGMTGLAAIFVLLYVLGKEEQYLYNVTLFGYPDRIQRRRTGSFLWQQRQPWSCCHILQRIRGDIFCF